MISQREEDHLNDDDDDDEQTRECERKLPTIQKTHTNTLHDEFFLRTSFASSTKNERKMKPQLKNVKNFSNFNQTNV
jgi:uncharacterized membrane-anchored protein